MAFWEKGRDSVDYDEEGRKLIERLNIEAPKEVFRYNNLDVIWKHPKTGGAVFVGGVGAAGSLEVLKANDIAYIMNCTRDMKLHFPSNFEYYRHDISWWRASVKASDPKRKLAQVHDFYAPAFAFIINAIMEGKNVLIHCLAGAHRAGTMGVSTLMLLAQLPVDEAIRAAKLCRPAINPIGSFPTLLQLLQQAMEGEAFETDPAVSTLRKSL